MTPLEVLETELSGEYMTDRQADALAPLRALVAAALAQDPPASAALAQAARDYRAHGVTIRETAA